MTNILEMIQVKEVEEGMEFQGSEIVSGTIIEYYKDSEGNVYFLEV